MEQWTICGHSTEPGTKKQIIINPNVPDYEIPATMICGKEDGKTMVITAGIHSDEYPGIAAVIRAAAEIDPAEVSGRVLLIHCVNTSGFWMRSPACVPEDGVNLNHMYPGDPAGTTGYKIADFFVREVFPHADFLADLHSGGQMEPLTPCLFFPAAAGERVRKISLEAAKALDIPYLIPSTASKGEYSYAASVGVPGLLIERGFSGYCDEEWIKAYMKDIFLLLNHFGVYNTEMPSEICSKKIFNKTIYLTSEEKGLWYPVVKEDTKVNKGDLLGHVEDFFGNTIKSYRAEADGTVFYYTCGLAVNPGTPLAAYGLDEFAE